jgi:hypothetical protein
MDHVVRYCAVCGARIAGIGAQKVQPRSDGSYRCRTCQELGELFAGTFKRHTAQTPVDDAPAN